MFNIFKRNKSEQLVSPIDGQLIVLEDVSDEVFSTKVMGEGFAIEPSSNLVTSPTDGEITNIFPTKHALSIITNSGVEILLHLGIDTVELNGAPFEVLVNKGQKVAAGDELVRMDRSKIKSTNKEDTVILVLPGKQDVTFDPAISNRKVLSGELVTSFK